MANNTRYPIGVSSYADGTSSSPHGKMQTVVSLTLAQQICSAAFEFDRDVLQWNGEHLTPNEGVREYERQVELYDLYKNHGGALAAYPGTSTHGPQIGSAVDWGVTRVDGSNRALTNAEWPLLYAILERRGIVHTGAHFNPKEAWHVNGGYAQYVPPIPNAPLPGTYTPPKTTPVGDIVSTRIMRIQAAGVPYKSYLFNVDTLQKAFLDTADKEDFWRKNMAVEVVATNKDGSIGVQPSWALDAFKEATA